MSDIKGSGNNSMCSVKYGDVKYHVDAMKEMGKRGILVQTSGKKYVTMDNSPTRNGDACKFTENMTYEYCIDMDTTIVHIEGCDKCGDDNIKARLVNAKSTGLELCTCVK